jgi:hypothetical protein
MLEQDPIPQGRAGKNPDGKLKYWERNHLELWA